MDGVGALTFVIGADDEQLKTAEHRECRKIDGREIDPEVGKDLNRTDPQRDRESEDGQNADRHQVECQTGRFLQNGGGAAARGNVNRRLVAL